MSTVLPFLRKSSSLSCLLYRTGSNFSSQRNTIGIVNCIRLSSGWKRGSRNRSHQTNFKFKFGATTFLMSFSLFGSVEGDANKSDESNPNQDIVSLIKQAKASLNGKEGFDKAEAYYLKALHKALERKDHAVIAHVQDLLANLALENGQVDKAEPLFRNVLQNLVANGTPQNDPAVLEVSLKLATIYAVRGEKDLALSGFEWSSNTCKENLKEMNEKKISTQSKEYRNSQALLGMILDSYGRYLHDIKENKKALSVTSEAINLCQQLYGERDSRTLVLYNDIASIQSEMGNYDVALKYALLAVEVSESLPDDRVDAAEKAVFYTNLAYIYIKQGKIENAERTFKQALLEASKTKDEYLKANVAALINVFPDTAGKSS